MEEAITLEEKCQIISCDKATKEVIVGGFLATLMAGSLVLSSLMLPFEMPLISCSFVVAIPFLISFLVTRRFIDALCLVWMNEIFFGGAGRWISVGPIPGRGILLALLLIFFFVGSIRKKFKNRNSLFRVRKRELWIIFYGIVLPSLLFLYSIGFGTVPTSALSDVQRLFGLLAFFPLRKFLRRNFNYFLGWFGGACVILAALFYLMAFSSPEVRTPLIMKWLTASELFDLPDLTTLRAAFTPQILLFVGIFLGALYATDSFMVRPKQVVGFTLLLVSFGTFVGNFVRGPLLSIGFIFCIMAIMARHSPYRSISHRMILLFVFLAILSSAVILSMGEDATWRFKLIRENWLDEARVEQSEIMINEWLKEPIFGQGVGRQIAGYTREDGSVTDTRLALEVQYLVILYRIGIVGFVAVMFPFLLFFRNFRKLWLEKDLIIHRSEGKFMVSMLCAIGALLISSLANAYFASVYTPFFVGTYLAADDVFARNKIVK